MGSRFNGPVDKAGSLQCGFWPRNPQILIWKLPWILGWIFSSCFFQGKRPEKIHQKSTAKFTREFGRKNSPRISAEAVSMVQLLIIFRGYQVIQRWPAGSVPLGAQAIIRVVLRKQHGKDHQVRIALKVRHVLEICHLSLTCRVLLGHHAEGCAAARGKPLSRKTLGVCNVWPWQNALLTCLLRSWGCRPRGHGTTRPFTREYKKGSWKRALEMVFCRISRSETWVHQQGGVKPASQEGGRGGGFPEIQHFVRSSATPHRLQGGVWKVVLQLSGVIIGSSEIGNAASQFRNSCMHCSFNWCNGVWEWRGLGLADGRRFRRSLLPRCVFTLGFRDSKKSTRKGPEKGLLDPRKVHREGVPPTPKSRNPLVSLGKCTDSWAPNLAVKMASIHPCGVGLMCWEEVNR